MKTTWVDLGATNIAEETVVDPGSVTELLQGLKRGDTCAVEGLWRRYFDRMSARARQHLLGDRATADEEDAAISAFGTFCRHVMANQFENVANRNELWALLVTLTRRKVTQRLRHEHRKKRGGGVRHQPLGPKSDGRLDALGWSDVEDTRCLTHFSSGLDLHCQELLEMLPDETLQGIAVRRLEGYSNAEIATELRVALRSIERKVSRIKALWMQECIS